MLILNIINDIKDINKYKSNELFEKLLINRLDTSLKNYCSDIKVGIDYFENRINNKLLEVAKKVVK